MEVILLERVAKLGQMGEVVRVKDGFARNFLLEAQQGAARHRGQSRQVRRHEGRTRSPQPAGQGRSHQGRREDRRPQRRRAAPGFRDRPVVRIGDGSRHHRLVRGRWCRHQPQPGDAGRADQDHRQAQHRHRRASGSRSQPSASPSRAAPTRPSASTAAKTSPRRQEDQDAAAEALAAAGEFFDPEARRDDEPQEEPASDK